MHTLQTETTLSAGSLDSSRVAELYSEHSSELRAFLTGVLRNADLAGEVLQTTFLKAAELGHTADSSTIKGWLFRVAFNEAMLIKRRQDVDQRATQKVAWITNQTVESADQNTLKSEMTERIRKQLELLPAELRVIVRMRVYEDLTFAQISERLGVPMGTVVSRMRTALQRLGQELKDYSSTE